MYSTVLLNSSTFPALELSSLKAMLSNTFKRTVITTPVSFQDISQVLQKSSSESTLFLILSSKNNSSEVKFSIKKLLAQNKFVLVYYAGLEGYDQYCVKTFDQLVFQIKTHFYKDKMQTMLPIPSIISKPGQQSNIWVIAANSKNPNFRTTVKQIYGNIQHNLKANFEQNFDFQTFSTFYSSDYSILILNDQDIQRHQQQFNKLTSQISKERLVTMLFTKQALIPYGFCFDEIVTTPEQLQTKINWLVNQYYKTNNGRKNTFIATRQGRESTRSISQNRNSSQSDRISIGNRMGTKVLETDRRRSQQSQLRRQSRKSRNSKRVSFGQTMQWVCIKKPTGYYVTLPQQQYRTNGIARTFYGNEARSSILNNKRTSSISQRNSVLLKKQLSNLEQRPSRQPSIISSNEQQNTYYQNNLQKSSPIQITKRKSEIKQIKQVKQASPVNNLIPRRQSTIGYNDLNMDALLNLQAVHFSPSPPQTIPSTMSFGSLSSIAAKQTASNNKQNNYFVSEVYSNVQAKNSPRLTSSLPFNTNQFNAQRVVSQNSKILASSQMKSCRSRKGTMGRQQLVYYPSSLQNLKYQIMNTFPNKFYYIQYRNLIDLQQSLSDLDGISRPIIIFSQQLATQAHNLFNFKKQSFMQAIVYSLKKDQSKYFSGMSQISNNQQLLSEISRMQSLY